MKIKKIISVGVILLASTFVGNAQGLGNLLNGLGGKTGEVLGNVIEGVFTKSNLTLSDIVGDYKSDGPAVTFKSEGLLQKAGGIAGAAKIEAELKPYYEKYGLTGMTLTIDENANYSMNIKGMNLKGNITKNDSDGTFIFNFNIATFKLGSFTAYIEKSGSTLKLMFDATKLKSFISMVAKITGNSMTQAVGSVLDSYDGACVGFKMIATANNETSSGSSSGSNSNSGSTISKGLDTLKGILNKGN